MKQKLGPLQLWQWAAIGVAAGLGYYLYLRGKSSGQPPPTPTVAQTDNTAQPYGPIDPTTGLPFAYSLLQAPAPAPAPAPPQVIVVNVTGDHRRIGPPVRWPPSGAHRRPLAPVSQ